MCGGQVLGQAFQQGFAVLGAGLALLLKFDDIAADMPIAGGEETIDRADRRSSGLVEELGNAGEELIIVDR